MTLDHRAATAFFQVLIRKADVGSAQLGYDAEVYGPNGGRGDVRDHGGYLGPVLTLPGVVVKATERWPFALCSATFSLLG